MFGKNKVFSILFRDEIWQILEKITIGNKEYRYLNLIHGVIQLCGEKNSLTYCICTPIYIYVHLFNKETQEEEEVPFLR